MCVPQVLGEHSSILNRGLLMDVPTIQDVLNGVYPPVSKNADLEFLFSFIEDKEGTLASRLARFVGSFYFCTCNILVLYIDFILCENCVPTVLARSTLER